MKKMYLFVSVVAAVIMLLTACGPAATPTAAPVVVPPTATAAPVVPVLLPTATAAPVVAPTPNPLGTSAMPIVLAFAPSVSSTQLTTGGQAFADQLSKMTGYTFKTTVPTSYAAQIEAMGSGNAQVGFLAPAAYIVAHAKGYGDVAMISLRAGADHYAFQFIVNKARIDDKTFTVYYDPKTGKDTANAATALAQFKGKKLCSPDPLSASGYLVPAGLLVTSGFAPSTVAFVQGHPAVVKAIYLSPKGEICDFGATFTPTTNISTKTDFLDYATKVVTVYVSDPLIPNDTVAFGKTLPADMRQKISDAIVQMATTPDGLKILDGFGYSWSGVKVVDDTFFDDFRVFLQSVNFDFNNYK